MKRDTPQTIQWAGEFGRAYTNRNPHSPEEQDALYTRNYGVSRSALNEEFLAGMDRSMRILEVGCNVGVQLMALEQLGFSRLFGLEIQSYALREAKHLAPGAHLTQASAQELPFEDAAFDLVFTSGVLIHISPDHVGKVMSEICRCSRRYIWGFEYFAEQHTPIPYRGNENLMWKADFASLYRQHFPNVVPVKERRVRYLADENVDAMFLLEKRGEGNAP